MMTDPEEVKRLIRGNPWATFVSHTSNGLIASHYPVLLDENAEGITILSHFGRPDEKLHELGEREMLVIIQGPHDYVSASWYEPGDLVATWNHVTAHLYGIPEILSEEENYQVLSRLTDHFEQHYPGGRSLAENEAGTRRAAKGTVGLRMRKGTRASEYECVRLLIPRDGSLLLFSADQVQPVGTGQIVLAAPGAVVRVQPEEKLR